MLGGVAGGIVGMPALFVGGPFGRCHAGPPRASRSAPAAGMIVVGVPANAIQFFSS
ncbi:hypothetical protein [Nocardia sp. NPDC052112]|uniref:hypothetical protein n=1 Tax=Nocardia sp. NPDC052112 TaxID=3155646 RepID=UPI003438C938